MKNFDLEKWLDELETKIINEFEQKVLFIGIQGSYNRGEATENSDIDIVIILDELNLEDLIKYKQILKTMHYNNKACGFISGKAEIENWSKSDIFQFIYDTKPIYGDLKKIVKLPTKEDIKKSIKVSCENLYHASCHSFLYDENIKESLIQLYKMTFFIIQAEYYLQTNTYVPTKIELYKKIKNQNKEILDVCLNKENICKLNQNEVEKLYEKLIIWCSKRIQND